MYYFSWLHGPYRLKLRKCPETPLMRRPQCQWQTPWSLWKQETQSTHSKNQKFQNEGSQRINSWTCQVKPTVGETPSGMWRTEGGHIQGPDRLAHIRGLLGTKGRAPWMAHTPLASYPYLLHLWQIWSDYKHTALLFSGSNKYTKLWSEGKEASRLISQRISGWSLITFTY